jgi:asparagine synthase (glutamine-hydrolysing)
MSGIAGILSKNNPDIVIQMLNKIKHRGSSDHHIWEGPNTVLGAIGLTNINEMPGPVTTASGERAIVLDGRINNSATLQKNLKFHEITNESDIEIALHAYEEFGTRIFGRLDGGFALAIVDSDRILLARDRLGICPLYYGFKNDTLCFASEIKALSGTADKIHEFPPGHFLSSDRGIYPYQPYFPESIYLDGVHDSAKRLTKHIQTAVQRAISSKVEVGVWLSGGVDSSVVAALARPYLDNLHTFSTGMAGAPDLEYARQVARHIGSDHHERIYNLEDMLAIVGTVIYFLESFDAPLVRSAIANYLVSELASDHVSFVLSGEGGDELFAGYAYQKDIMGKIELTMSIQDAIAALHNTALQRVDRSAAAHSTGVAVPFLDPDVVRYALAIPARWKIRGSQKMDKWPLRHGLSDTLPDEVIWRGKSKFWEGTGSGNMIEEHAEEAITDKEFAEVIKLSKDFRIRSKEELFYYRIFKQHYGDTVPLYEIGRTHFI